MQSQQCDVRLGQQAQVVLSVMHAQYIGPVTQLAATVEIHFFQVKIIKTKVQ